MNSSDKYLQQGILNSDENFSSLWERLHLEHSNKYTILAKTRTESFLEFQVNEPETTDDFMEVWMSIEESIRNFEIAQGKQKEEQSEIY